MGAAAAANLAEQQERSTVGMKTKSKVPSSKSKGTFQGYGGDAPLQTTEAKMQTTRRGANGGPPARPPLHPWLDYPPTSSGRWPRTWLRSSAPSTPPSSSPRSPRSSSTRSPATSDSSRRSSPFPSTRCVRRTRTAVAPRPPFPPARGDPRSPLELERFKRRCTCTRTRPIRSVPRRPILPRSLTFEIPPRRPIHRMESRPCSSPSAWASERRARVEGGGDVTPSRCNAIGLFLILSRSRALARSHRTTASRLTFEHSFTFASPSPRHHLPAIIPATPTSPATSDPKLAASC